MYNIACGKRYTLNELYAKICSKLGVDIEPVYVDARAGDVKHSLAEIELIKKELGYKILVDFEEGLNQTVQWYTEANAQTR